jgi:hypothetical protein
MPRYTSRTGRDVVLRFKGTEITVPAGGYYETSADDLADTFPKHVRKVELNEIIREIERRLLPVNIKSIDTPKLTPITLAIAPVQSPDLTPIVINSLSEISLAPIKEVSINPKNHEKILEIINNSMNYTNDPDLNEFLGMIRDILSSEK